MASTSFNKKFSTYSSSSYFVDLERERRDGGEERGEGRGERGGEEEDASCDNGCEYAKDFYAFLFIFFCYENGLFCGRMGALV